MNRVDRPPFSADRAEEPFIFVCYADANRAEVLAELGRLREAGVRLWGDEHNAPDSEWTEQRANAIRKCDRFLYFVSPVSVATRSCRDEVQFARNQHKSVIAVHLYQTDLPGGLDLAIGATQGILKYRMSASDYERKLFAALRDGVEASQAETPPSSPTMGTASRAQRVVVAAGLTALVAVALLAHRLIALPRTPTIGPYTQLTMSRVVFSAFPNLQRLATDGAAVYFNEWRGGGFVPRQVSARRGESAPVAIAPQLPQLIVGTSPDQTELLIGSSGDGPWWLWGLEGGSSRQLGGLTGHDLSWSADGTRLVNLVGDDIVVAGADGSDPKVIYTARAPDWAEFSPDGEHIRFTNGGDEIWEIGADGHDPHPLLLGAAGFERSCCGSWSRNGRHFVFQGTRDNEHHLWVIDETRGPFGARLSEPHQLTTGAMNFISPLIAPDGKRLYAVGWHLRGELVRYDVGTGRFMPHFGSRSIEWLAFSRDGRRAAYVSYPERELWASNADGSEAVQLTQRPLRPVNPAWSPAADLIAFSAAAANQTSRIYLVPPDASTAPRRLTSGDAPESAPSWSADGSRLAYSTSHGIRLINVDGGQETALIDTAELRDPSWSPDGTELTAIAKDPARIMRYRFATSKWDELARAPDATHQGWTFDGKSVVFVTSEPEVEVHRIVVADLRVERVLSLKKERWVWGVAGVWVGFAPDGSIMFLRDQSVQHIYALDWDA